jgi:hypothetical protein
VIVLTEDELSDFAKFVNDRCGVQVTHEFAENEAKVWLMHKLDGTPLMPNQLGAEDSMDDEQEEAEFEAVK